MLFSEILNPFHAINRQEYQELSNQVAQTRQYSEFRGLLFEDLAYEGLRKTCEDKEEIASHPETLEFYKGLYPDKRLIPHAIQGPSIDGISVPDYLIFGQEKNSRTPEESVKYIVECSLGLPNTDQWRSYIRKKIGGFLASKRTFPQWFSNAHMLFVLPRGETLPYSSRRRPDIEYINMPFTLKDFYDFSSNLLRCNTSPAA